MNGDQEQVLLVHKMKIGTIYKLIFIGLVVPAIPLGVVSGVCAFLGSDSVKWNNESIHGIGALFAGPAIGVFIALLIAGMLGSVTSLGLWLFSLARPISIRFVPTFQLIERVQSMLLNLLNLDFNA